MNVTCCYKYKSIYSYQILLPFKDMLYNLMDSKNKIYFQINPQDSIWQSS